MPDKNCIKLWLGSGTDVATTVQDLEQEQLFPLQAKIFILLLGSVL
jgi:hypothetical protein